MVISKAKIIENTQLAQDIWRMVFESQEIAKEYQGPGQFVSILANNNWEHPIRRPMSIADVTEDKITIIYKIFGLVTKVLRGLVTESNIDVLGPLGNTFKIIDEKYTPVLVGGGIGLSPILNLSNYFNKKPTDHFTIIGAKNKNEHFLEHNLNAKLYLSTDDGSVGIKGTAIDTLNSILKNIENPFIYACGPEPMLSALKTYLSPKNIPGQFSVESYMACGFGFCQGCAIPTNDEHSYSLVCKDGPVYGYNEVKFG